MQTQSGKTDEGAPSNAVVYFIAVIVIAGILMVYKFFFS